MTRFHCPVAWTGSEYAEKVVVETAGAEITAVTIGDLPGDATRLEGVTFPGFVNTHSHVFHRLVRGQAGAGDFWSWRDAMYEVASLLDPESYRHIAVATYREMVAAGYTSVTEFHYLHHQPDGTPYDDPNVMADALVDAAAETGIRLTLLDTCYLSSGFGEPAEGVQRRFADAHVEAWAERVSTWRPPPGLEVGAAIHSVRAVSPDQIPVVAAWARDRPLHVHVSEQPVENQACLHHHGRTPTQVLADAGALAPNVTVVHVTHVSAADIALLAAAGVTASICPTTERWLGDGIGPTPDLAQAGIPLVIGSDSQAVIDPLEEARLLELHQRLATGRIGSHHPAFLIGAATGGRTLAPGRPADLVTVSTASPRTAGVEPDNLVFAATAADVVSVVIGGRRLV